MQCGVLWYMNLVPSSPGLWWRNFSFLNIFHQNVQSLGNKKVNLKILLNTNLLNIDVLGVTEHWLIDDEISCYNLPNFSLVSKYCRQNKRNGGSCIYVRSNILAKPITNFKHSNLNEHFKVSIVKLVHFKIIIICTYRNTNSNIQIMLDSLEIILDYRIFSNLMRTLFTVLEG
jgi:hypothetical protein